MKTWMMTTLPEKMIKIGAKVVRHAKYVTFQMVIVNCHEQPYTALSVLRYSLFRLSPKLSNGAVASIALQPTGRL